MNNAFLHSDLFEEVYMDMPLGYQPPISKSSRQGERLVCRLNKSIYGLKQASQQWFAKFSADLLSMGFHQSKFDYSLFIQGTGSAFLALLVDVDDIIITEADISLIETLQSLLNTRFLLKDLGSLKFFLGLEIARSSTGICLSQRHYTLSLLEENGLLGCKPTSMPMDPNEKLSAEGGNLLHDSIVYPLSWPTFVSYNIAA